MNDKIRVGGHGAELTHLQRTPLEVSQHAMPQYPPLFN
jgi:hypothetical protein